MRHLLVALSLLFASARSADAQVSVSFGVDIGVHVPVYPELVVVPGYPVYYAPYAETNYFFYDGVYWVYQRDAWYASSWYNGPWRLVRPESVPLYVLRVPVRYYRVPPPYFRDWHPDHPPRWGEHWGPGWHGRHRGWDHWDRRGVPRPAPLPVYQREYAGDRYPRSLEQQHQIRAGAYPYRPRETFAREHFRGGPPAPPPPRPEPRRDAFGAPPPRDGPMHGGGPRGEIREDRREQRREDRREERRDDRREQRREERREDRHEEHGHGRGH